jgi:hypothetical protein
MNGLVHPPTTWRCFVALLVSEFEKELGSVPNGEHERFVVNIVFRARDIPKRCVTFPEVDCGYVIATSLKHQDVNYKVYNLEFEWVCCECL